METVACDQWLVVSTETVPVNLYSVKISIALIVQSLDRTLFEIEMFVASATEPSESGDLILCRNKCPILYW